MASENWRPVVGYEGMYEVSDNGRVKSLISGRNLKPFSHGGVPGILYVTLRDRNSPTFKPRYKTVHRIVLEAFVGKPTFTTDRARHLDGDRQNNRLGNLAWGTLSEAFADTRNPYRKDITKKVVLEIRRRSAAGETIKKISDDLVIGYSVTLRIARGKSFTSVQ